MCASDNARDLDRQNSIALRCLSATHAVCEDLYGTGESASQTAKNRIRAHCMGSAEAVAVDLMAHRHIRRVCAIRCSTSHTNNGVFTRSSKRPANFQQMYSKYTC